MLSSSVWIKTIWNPSVWIVVISVHALKLKPHWHCKNSDWDILGAACQEWIGTHMMQQQLDAGEFQRLGIERATAGLLVQGLLLLGALNPSEVARHCCYLIYHFNTNLSDTTQSLHHWLFKLHGTHFYIPLRYVSLLGPCSTAIYWITPTQRHYAVPQSASQQTQLGLIVLIDPWNLKHFTLHTITRHYLTHIISQIGYSNNSDLYSITPT